MRRVEAVIQSWKLDTFREVAPRLGISEFDVVEVYTSQSEPIAGQRLYRGSEYTADLLPHLRLEFVALGGELESMLHNLLEVVQPESVAIFKLDHTIH